MGRHRHAGRRLYRSTAGLAGAQLRYSLADLRTLASPAYECSDFCIRHLWSVRDLVLCRAADLPGPLVLRQAGCIHVLGLATGAGVGCHHLADGFTRGKEYAELEWPITLLI